jgi:alpha-L-arabinofuranosidase
MQWATDLIGYDASRAYGSPSYYAQVLFASHLGDQTVKSTADGVNPRFFWSATVSTSEKVLHLKLVNAANQTQPLTLHIKGAGTGTATAYTLHAATAWVTNTIDQPEKIKPVLSKLTVASGSWTHNVSANQIEVIDIPLQ